MCTYQGGTFTTMATQTSYHLVLFHFKFTRWEGRVFGSHVVVMTQCVGGNPHFETLSF